MMMGHETAVSIWSTVCIAARSTWYSGADHSNGPANTASTRKVTQGDEENVLHLDNRRTMDNVPVLMFLEV